MLKIDALVYLQCQPEPFDVVFLDPPFAADLGRDLCRLLEKYGLLKRGAQVYLEQDREQPISDLPEGWELLREKTAGRVRFALLKAKD